MQLPEIAEQGKSQKPVLDGKLRPPRLRKVLERPRLLLQPESSAPRLINICAGPGFGKTTLMAQMAREFSGNSIWYQVDALDRDPAVFLRHMISGFSHACDFEGTRARSRLEDVTDFATESESVLAVLLDELGEHSRVPLIICFDDFQLFDDNADASRLIEYLIQNLPEQSCIAITTRRYPELSLARLRSSGALLELKDEDLQFSLDELSSLTDAWEIDVSAAVLERVYRSTEGWPAGLVLSESFLRSGNDMPDLISHRRIKQNVYEYLAEEVLNSQSAGMQQLLISAALIDPIDPAICEKALDIPRISEMLAEAEQRNLFTNRLDDAELYRYHPLFRDFLQSRLQIQAGMDGMNDIRARFAEAFISAGHDRKAIEQYLAGGQHAKAITLIEKIGDEILNTAEYGTLQQWLSALKEDDLTPALQIQQAKILMAAGKFRKAMRILHLAESSLDNNNIELIGHCLIAKADCLSNLDRYEDATCELKSLLRISLPAPIRQQVLFQLCAIYWFCNDQEGLQSSLNLALKDPTAPFSPHDIEIRIIACMQNLRNGFFSKAHKLLISNLKSGCLSESHTNLHLNNLASCLMMMGDYSNAIIYAEQCKQRIESQGEFKLFGVVCDTLGCLKIALGSEQEGTRILIQALDQTPNNEPISEWMNSPLLCHLGSNARRQGDLDKAIDYHSKSIPLADDDSGLYDIAAGKANIGADLVRIRKFKEAERLFIDANKLATKYNFTYIQTQIDFNRAWAAYLTRDNKQMLSLLKLALHRAKEFQQNHYIIQEGKISLPLLMTALENGIEIEYTCWILRQIGEESLSVIEPLLNHDDENLREKLAELLCDIDSAGALSLLRRMRHDSSESVQNTVRVSLAKLRKNLERPMQLLTPREAEVLECISQGLTNNQIAQKLYIADCTVKTHAVKIFRKLGFTSRIDAILYYQQHENKSTTFYK